MVTVTAQMQAPPARVFEVLSDGWTYAGWVVGTSRIRQVDSDWPSVGALIHHSVGVWPLLIDDHTRVVELEAGRRLRLRVRGWPAGEADVELTVAPDGDGSLVSMAEAPAAGPGSWLANPVTDAALRARNVESLRRLSAVVEHG